MFKSIDIIDYNVEPSKNGECFDLFLIIDDDFTENVIGSIDSVAREVHAGAPSAIINCYSKRNLPVVSNLILFFLYYEKIKGASWNIQAQLEWCLKYQKQFKQYYEEIEKYLLLI